MSFTEKKKTKLSIFLLPSLKDGAKTYVTLSIGDKVLTSIIQFPCYTLTIQKSTLSF